MNRKNIDRKNESKKRDKNMKKNRKCKEKIIEENIPNLYTHDDAEYYFNGYDSDGDSWEPPDHYITYYDSDHDYDYLTRQEETYVECQYCNRYILSTGFCICHPLQLLVNKSHFNNNYERVQIGMKNSIFRAAYNLTINKTAFGYCINVERTTIDHPFSFYPSNNQLTCNVLDGVRSVLDKKYEIISDLDQLKMIGKCEYIELQIKVTEQFSENKIKQKMLFEKELIKQVMKPSRLENICNKYDMDICDLIELYEVGV